MIICSFFCLITNLSPEKIFSFDILKKNCRFLVQYHVIVWPRLKSRTTALFCAFLINHHVQGLIKNLTLFSKTIKNTQ